MSSVQYFTFEGFGERVQKSLHCSQAVRFGNVVKTAGQVGLDRNTEKIPPTYGGEVDQAFDNVQAALEKAGSAGWPEVYQVRIFIVGLATAESGHVTRNLRARCPNHAPLLTVVGVEKLSGPMKIEIEAEAYIQ